MEHDCLASVFVDIHQNLEFTIGLSVFASDVEPHGSLVERFARQLD